MLESPCLQREHDEGFTERNILDQPVMRDIQYIAALPGDNSRKPVKPARHVIQNHLKHADSAARNETFIYNPVNNVRKLFLYTKKPVLPCISFSSHVSFIFGRVK